MLHLISIIVFLVSSQTYRSVEIIVVNDGFDDDTLSICMDSLHQILELDH